METPEPPSLGLSVTVTSESAKPVGTPDAVVTGAVLSTRREAMTLGLLTLPALSVTVTRTSYMPSVAPVVFQLAVYGAVVALATPVQVFAPAGEIS